MIFCELGFVYTYRLLLVTWCHSVVPNMLTWHVTYMYILCTSTSTSLLRCWRSIDGSNVVGTMLWIWKFLYFRNWWTWRYFIMKFCRIYTEVSWHKNYNIWARWGFLTVFQINSQTWDKIQYLAGIYSHCTAVSQPICACVWYDISGVMQFNLSQIWLLVLRISTCYL